MYKLTMQYIYRSFLAGFSLVTSQRLLYHSKLAEIDVNLPVAGAEMSFLTKTTSSGGDKLRELDSEKRWQSKH